MIVRERPNALQVMFALRGSILPSIARPLACMLVISLLAVALHHLHPQFLSGLATTPFTLMGLSLSIFMSFRNTACFNRWWEGRVLWGRLIIASRSFSRQVSALPLDRRAPLLEGLAAFALGLAARLRARDEIAALATHMPRGAWTSAPNPTDAALATIGRRCAELVTAGVIDPMRYSVLETQLNTLSEVQGGCERINGTPLPFAYSLLLHRTAYAFCGFLPFALVPALDWWTPIPTLLISYAFFGLDALGDELGNPFGFDPNDLPLDALARTVEREMLHAAGHADLPPGLRPQDHLLT